MDDKLRNMLQPIQENMWLDYVLRYSASVLVVILAFWLYSLMTAWFGPGLPTYILFYPAVIIVALLCGFGPGLLATALSVIMAATLILQPIGIFELLKPIDEIGVTLFTAMGVLISSVAELYRRNQEKAEKEISYKNKVLDGINTIFRAAITHADEEEFGRACLAVCEELTVSKISFIGEINEHGRFDSIAVSEHGWQACEMVKEQGAESVNDNVIRGIRGRALTEKKILIFNDPTNSPYWSGLPEGHYPITSFLGAPLLYRDNVIGLIALANKEGGYSKEDIGVMEVIKDAITESLMHYRALNRLEVNQVELKQTITELERSNKELQSFAYITSHDLQEPLRTMGSYAGLLKRRYGGQFDSDADEFFDYMVSGAQRMQDMIQGLIDYSRVGTRGKDFKEFNSEDALNAALNSLKSSIDECNAEVTSDSLPNIVGDESQISRVFLNLIGNALKFRKENVPPKIHISARREDKEHVFSVSDNGIGLEEQYSDHIFEVFKRLHAIGKYQGAGIGLAIIKRIIDRHGGRIWVESEFGVGSTFYFTIPINK